MYQYRPSHKCQSASYMPLYNIPPSNICGAKQFFAEWNHLTKCGSVKCEINMQPLYNYFPLTRISTVSRASTSKMLGPISACIAEMNSSHLSIEKCMISKPP